MFEINLKKIMRVFDLIKNKIYYKFNEIKYCSIRIFVCWYIYVLKY